jgi:RHS repeat-associated protein
MGAEELVEGAVQRRMYYSAAWQLLHEEIDEDGQEGDDRWIQQVWGIRYIDDPVLRRVDVLADDAPPELYYHLTDVQYSTRAMTGIGLYPRVLERVRYQAYGKATHRWPGDFNEDGFVNSTDQGMLTSAWNATMGQSGYDALLDLNRDGVINSGDQSEYNQWSGKAAIADGDISDPSGPDNVFGWGAYVFDRATGLCLSRFRHYSPSAGTWLNRDPVGYLDGMNRYVYVRNSPVLLVDPFGLCGCQPPDGDGEDFINDFFNNLDDCPSIATGNDLSRQLDPDGTPFYDLNNPRDRELLEKMVDEMEKELQEIAAAAAQGAIAGVECASICALGPAEIGTVALYLAKQGYKVVVKGGKKVVVRMAAKKAAKKTAEAAECHRDELMKVMKELCSDSPASSSYAKDALKRRLAMEEQGVAIAGAGHKTKIKDINRLVKQYGGKPEEWTKKRSCRFTLEDGTQTEIHWYENIKTGQRVEYKTKIDEILKKCEEDAIKRGQ